MVGFGTAIYGFFKPQSLTDSTRQLGEFSIVVTGLTIVMLGGGIDLSVGSIFALACFSAVGTFFILEQPVWVAFARRAGDRPRARRDQRLPRRLHAAARVPDHFGHADHRPRRLRHPGGGLRHRHPILLRVVRPWDFIGDGTVFGFSVAVLTAVVIAILAHIALTRSRPGWHILAVGGSRRSAFNSGINVKRTVFMTYVISGLCCGLAGFLFACRLSGAGPGTGAGLEILALTAAVVGGNSLGGGRGSIVKGVDGRHHRAGDDQRPDPPRLRHRLQPDGAGPACWRSRWCSTSAGSRTAHKVLNELYVAPIHHRMGETQSALPGSGTPYALNNRLSKTEYIGLGEIEGPEDVILDRDDHLYCGTRHGEIVRFFAPDYKRSEVFAHTGGFPLGLAFDQAGNLLSCVGAMGLYSISQARRGDQALAPRPAGPGPRSSTMRGCAIPTIATWRRTAASSSPIPPRATTRTNGRWIRSRAARPAACCATTRRPARRRRILDRYRYANGVCIAHDGKSLFMAESWACRVHRYWFDGPKKGQVECVIKDMPGYPDNINRASDGTYWMAWLGMRTPSFDLALRSPGMRKRMTRRLPQDEWLFPNINTGGVVKFDETGRIVETLGDLSGESHPMVTSMREHKGYLYVGGILNNRIGRYRIPGADPSWTGPDLVLGAKS